MNDLPSTNASNIVLNVNQVMTEFTNVFVYAKPLSFYERLFPKDFIDIFVSFTALQWLPDKIPAPSEGLAFYTTLPYNDLDAYQKWMTHQENALKTFYRLRYLELKENGLLMIGLPNPHYKEEERERVIFTNKEPKRIFNIVL